MTKCSRAQSNFDFNQICRTRPANWINNEKLLNVSNKIFPLILMMPTKYANVSGGTPSEGAAIECVGCYSNETTQTVAVCCKVTKLH